MQVIDLADEHRDLFAVCLEDWSAEAREAGPGRACWVERYRDRGLRAKVAVDEAGVVGGMIQYLPIEDWPILGKGLYFIPCIWVHGHRQGRGDFHGRGMGPALLAAAETDPRDRGALGMAAWGVALPFWMRASWYRKHGYRRADRQGLAVLMWKPFAPGARAPRWLPKGERLPDHVPGGWNVVVFNSAWCMARNLSTSSAHPARRRRVRGPGLLPGDRHLRASHGARVGSTPTRSSSTARRCAPARHPASRGCAS